MRTTHSISGRRKIAKSLAYYFIPTHSQLRKMLIVAGLGIVLLMAAVAWRSDAFLLAYRLVMGRPMVVTQQSWETFSCPEPGEPNKVCTKYTNTRQPGYFPTPRP